MKITKIKVAKFDTQKKYFKNKKGWVGLDFLKFRSLCAVKICYAKKIAS